MQLRARILAIVLLAMASPVASVAQTQSPDPDRLAAAKDMMDASRVDRQFEQVIPLLLDHLKQGFRRVAPDRADIIDSVFEQMQSRFISRRGELLEEIAGLYAQRLEASEMRAVADFYRSPVGAKLIDVQPQIMQESILAGQRWGQRIGREIEEEARRELKRRGVDL
ncbi:MAG TPA: DUF2059 domain-containing protein [Hyphomicrobiaceae bacterium]|jgi:uncharacterized protein|nr:DUF2059 domain-containing protein [Hyphomicrobiaceae bacterium]